MMLESLRKLPWIPPDNYLRRGSKEWPIEEWEKQWFSHGSRYHEIVYRKQRLPFIDSCKFGCRNSKIWIYSMPRAGDGDCLTIQAREWTTLVAAATPVAATACHLQPIPIIEVIRVDAVITAARRAVTVLSGLTSLVPSIEYQREAREVLHLLMQALGPREKGR